MPAKATKARQPRTSPTVDKSGDGVEKLRGKLRTRPGRNGGTLLAEGMPGNKGGRPPNEFKARMVALADRAAQALEAARILDDPEHPLYLDAAKWCADRGYGRPAQVVAGDPERPLTVRVVYE